MEKLQKTAFISSNGCPENLIDSARLKKYLEINGWCIENDPDNADIVFFNACGFTKSAEESSLNIIKVIQSRMKKDSRLLVWGCLPKINPKSLEQAQIYDSSLFGEQELFSKIDGIIKANTPPGEIVSNEVCQLNTTSKKNWFTDTRKNLYNTISKNYTVREKKLDLYRANDNSIFYIKVSTGCLGNCTYCAIRNSRGVIKSKSIEAIVKEFRSGLSKGYKEISLLGTDLGGQGRDKGYNLCDLLNELIKEKGDYKIGIRNVHPLFVKKMLNELEPILKTGKIWFIGVAAESGSNRILKLMARGYTVEEYVECYQRIKAACPDIVIRNQMLVGFPTETEQDFTASMKLLDITEHNEIYAFSPRTGTVAEKMKGQVPNYIKRLRMSRMLLKDIYNKNHQ
jgi:MiaB/RimO family radical SAM methylthiotransferase